MELRNYLVTAVLTLAGSFLLACDSASRTQTAAGNDTVASTAEPQAAPAPAAEPQTAKPASSPPAEAQQASSGSGQVKFNNFCRTCHSMREGDNRLGPSLHGVVGRKAGSLPDYPSYSQALAKSGIVWDQASLDKFLMNPDAAVPGNAMKPYAGLPDASVRKEIIEYLKSAEEN
jgi:cytochrome c